MSAFTLEISTPYGSYTRTAWTGGNVPPAGLRRKSREYRALVRFFFREELSECGGLDFWKCAGTGSMERARIFWGQATLDAWATWREMYRRIPCFASERMQAGDNRTEQQKTGANRQMNTNYAARLTAKIQARNEVNRVANERREAYIAALTPFVGQKVCKVDGTLLQKVAAALPEFEDGKTLSSYVTTGHGYNIRVCFKTWSGDPNGIAHYAEADVYIADLSDGVLTRIYDNWTPLRTDYSEAEIRALRERRDVADTTLRDLDSQLRDFGMHDN